MADTDAAVAEGSTCTVKDAGPCRKTMTFEISRDRISSLINEKFDGLADQVQLPGFRAGRAPKNLIKKRFGESVRDEVKQQLVAEAYQSAIKEHDLRVIGDPAVEKDVREAVFDGSSDQKFELDVEIAPEFELPELENLELKKPLIEITDEMIDGEVKRLQTNEGDLEERTDAEAGDYCVGQGVMTVGDETVHDIDGAVIQIPAKDSDGSGMALGVKIDDFAKQAGKPKAGDKLTFKVKGPDQHEIEAVRGKDVEIAYEVKEVHRIIPTPIAQLVEKLNIESEDRLRELISQRLNHRATGEQQNALRQQVARYLLDNIDFELPETLTERQATRNLERRRFDLMQRGMDEQEIETHVAELRAASNEVAVRELKLFFILDEVARRNEVQVSEPEVNGYIAQLAINNNRRPEELRTQLIRNNQINGIVQQIREHKSLDAAASKAKIEEMPLEDYNKHFESMDKAKSKG